MFSYKTAVAVKNLGFNNIKIYNGGIKDWQKAGLPLTSIHRLPEVEVAFIAAGNLKQALGAACTDSDDAALVTLLDFRNENFLRPDKSLPSIQSNCHTQTLLLDDLKRPEVRATIPRNGLVITITETGNRDAYAIRYLKQFGFSNIKGLKHGMRSWIKEGYPTESASSSH